MDLIKASVAHKISKGILTVVRCMSGDRHLNGVPSLLENHPHRSN